MAITGRNAAPPPSLLIGVFSTLTPPLLPFSHTGNFKAVYQRARAHAALCNEEAARRDFNMVEKLDPKLKPFIQQELKKLCETMRSVRVLQNKTYWDTAQERWGPGGGKTRGGGAAKSEESSQKSTKANEKKDNSEKLQKESSAETERASDAEADPDVRAEQRIKEAEGGRVSAEGLDNENM